MIHNLCNIIC